jgi:TonB family protein
MKNRFAFPRATVSALAVFLLLPVTAASESDPGAARARDAQESVVPSMRQDASPTMRAPGAEFDPMLRCARIRDVASQIRCFDDAKRASSRDQIGNAARDGARVDDARNNVRDESRHIARYAQEVTRELGKEMHHEDYPRRARDEGRGGTTELLLRIDSNANLTQVTVSRSSGYSDLDQFALNKVANLQLPKVPETIRSPLFTVRLPITFAIRAGPR